MNLALLKGVANYLKSFEIIHSLRRIEDNVFLLNLAKQTLYLDMTKGASNIFMADSILLSEKPYQAPFDLKLAQFTTNATLQNAYTDGNNRILILQCLKNATYKTQDFLLFFEFTGRYTNVILTDKNRIVIESLHHKSQEFNTREIKIGKIAPPLPQPANQKPLEIPAVEQIPLLLKQNFLQTYQKKLEQKRQSVLNYLESKKKALQIKYDEIESAHILEQEAKQFSHYGEVIFAFLHNIDKKQIFNSHITLKDFCDNDICITIPPKSKDFQSVANHYFMQSKKALKKAQNNHIQKAFLEDKINFLDAQIKFVKQSSDINDLSIFSKKNIRQKNSKKDIGEILYIDGLKVSIGRSAKDNQKLLESAKSHDLWLHIKDMPSAHLIIHCGKQMPRESTIKKCGEILGKLCVGDTHFVIDYTQRKFVKITNGSNVVYAKHKSFSY